MIIAVNTRFLLKDKLEGIGRFTHETLQLITKNHPEHTFYFLFDRPYDESFLYAANVIPLVVNPPARHAILWYWWFEKSIPKVLKKIKADIFVSPDGYISLQTKIPQLAVIHDLAFIHRPNDIDYISRKYYQYYFKKFAQQAKRIATVSEFSKDDIIKQYGINTSKIDVVYNGANENFKPLNQEEILETKKTFTDGKPYLVSVGALQPRKNISNLLLAFDAFKKKNKSDLKLVIVGRKAWGNKEMEKTYQNMQFQNEVIFTGRVSDDLLPKLVASAEALVYIPFFEGFGLPVLEALQCNVPCIVANNSSLPEVAGFAATYCEAENIDSIENSIEKILKTDIQLQLKSACLPQSKKYNWQKTANLLWESIQKTITNKKEIE